MSTFIKITFLYTFVFFSPLVFSQDSQNALITKYHDKLSEAYSNLSNQQEQEVYIKTILKKGKVERDTSALLIGHHFAAKLYRDNRLESHVDSLIELSNIKPNVLYPAAGYIIKGSYYYRKLDFKKALDNYLLANKYSRLYANENLIIQSTYYMGILKDKIGEYQDALKLHKENFNRINTNAIAVRDADYLTFLFAIANTYNELKQIDSASYYNSLGVKESKNRAKETEYYHFVLNEGVTQYYNQRNTRALDSLKKAMPHFEQIKDKQNSVIGYFYIGKAYLNIDRVDEAISMFKKVDTIFIEEKYIHPKLRETYEILIDYYKETTDIELELSYIKQLMKLDSVLIEDELYINKRIIKDYDTPKLISKKQLIISKLEDNNSTSRTIIFLLGAFLIVTGSAFYYQYQKRKTYKQRFQKILNQKTNQNDSTKQKLEDVSGLNISSEIIDEILCKLGAFENNQGYLKHGINLNDLAKEFSTNANYLSKVVNHYKKQSFINYLNRLRVHFAVEKLKSDQKFRHYTIKAISEDVGFNNTQSFTKAFFSKTGIMPSYFIKELKKMNQ